MPFYPIHYVKEKRHIHTYFRALQRWYDCSFLWNSTQY